MPKSRRQYKIFLYKKLYIETHLLRNHEDIWRNIVATNMRRVSSYLKIRILKKCSIILCKQMVSENIKRVLFGMLAANYPSTCQIVSQV